MNFARFNHILIPGTKDGRDQLRRTWVARVLFEPIARTYFALSDEGRALAVFMVLAGFAGLDVERSQSHLLWALLFSLLVASLLVRPLFALRSVRIRVEGPERMMAGEPARFVVTLENRGALAHDSLRIERPLLPWDGSWKGPRPRLPRLRPGEKRSVTASARFLARGPHHIDAFTASAFVPLRLALGPRVVSSGTRFTVVPRIARVASLRLPLSPRYQQGGVALASVTGEALELVGVRPYRPGDRIRDLHAKTWARTGEPAVRSYQQEYFSRIGVVLDTDGTDHDEERLEAAISLAAGIIAHLSRGEALIDLLVTGGRIYPLTVGRSLGHLDQALDHLASVEPGPRLSASELLERLRPHLARLSGVVAVFQAFDPERAALAEKIETTGVGCRAILVTGRTRTGPDALPGAVTPISIDDVRSACEGERSLAL